MISFLAALVLLLFGSYGVLKLRSLPMELVQCQGTRALLIRGAVCCWCVWCRSAITGPAVGWNDWQMAWWMSRAVYWTEPWLLSFRHVICVTDSICAPRVHIEIGRFFVYVGEYSVSNRVSARELSTVMTRWCTTCAVPSRIGGRFISNFDRIRPIHPHFSLMPSEI